jgi:hypothetical protein
LVFLFWIPDWPQKYYLFLNRFVTNSLIFSNILLSWCWCWTVIYDTPHFLFCFQNNVTLHSSSTRLQPLGEQLWGYNLLGCRTMEILLHLCWLFHSFPQKKIMTSTEIDALVYRSLLKKVAFIILWKRCKYFICGLFQGIKIQSKGNHR